ncbi:hypothetical protein [Acinetobacter baumannii]|uniref:hypothetical protein n=1 Tax=Acinetobacter baumannii TaxID=470 RepID=UPI001BC88985|nr:hypothetical protein [Acinetobacter baumannii]
MDKCREEFEQSPKTKELLSDSIYFDEKENRYKVNADGCLISVVFLNGRWEAWQSQQSKVEEQAQEIANLKSLIQGHELRHQQNLRIKQKLTRRSEELQKRVDAALLIANKNIEQCRVTEKRRDFPLWMQNQAFVIREQMQELEQALKGEGQ